MKIAIISDLHIPHWGHQFADMILSPLQESIAIERPDLIIDAGDTESPDWRVFYETYFPGINVMRVMGNHDFYHQQWNTVNRDHRWVRAAPAEKRVVGTTLWTDVNNGDVATRRVVAAYLNDFAYIGGFTTHKMMEAHSVQKQFLVDQFKLGAPDVVVTHHLPSFKSIHPAYTSMGEHDPKYLANYGFASRLDELVVQSGAKLWIHGHTHTACDYVLGNTRVVCNPCGYPFERRGLKSAYQPLYVEV